MKISTKITEDPCVICFHHREVINTGSSDRTFPFIRITLCTACRGDMHASLAKVMADCDELETKWRTALRGASDEHQERFVAFLEAAGSAYGPAAHPTRQRSIAEFQRRAAATVAKGGDFARLVTAWRAWHTRCADRDIMQVMMVFRAEATE